MRRIRNRFRRAYTLIELLAVLAIIAVIPILCLIVYVAIHFISKVW